MVVTPGVASARSSPFSFTTIPMISGRSISIGKGSVEFRHHLFAVRHLLHMLRRNKADRVDVLESGEHKLSEDIRL